MIIDEKAISVFGKDYFEKEFTKSEIVNILRTRFPEIGHLSFLPSDYCYNRYNERVSKEDFFMNRGFLFEYLGRNRYKVLGNNYPYTGKIFHKPAGKAETQIGEWINGKVKFFTHE